MVLSILLSTVFSVLSFSIPSAHAYLPNAKMPACLDGPDPMQIDNARVLKFKTTTRNQYLDRAFVKGKVIDAPSIRNGHDHFAISIGPRPTDTLEIIYNKEFGALPNIRVGDDIVVCGDYITSTAQAGRYPPSPEGAVMHWVHFNPGTRAGSMIHAHGFIMVGPNLIGFDEAPAGDWDGHVIPSKQPSGAGPNPESQAQQPIPNRRPAPSRADNRRPQSGHWKPCHTLEQCRARNGG